MPPLRPIGHAMLEPNLDAAAAFLDALCDEEAVGAAHTFQVYPDGNSTALPKPPLHGTLAELAPRLTALNRDRLGVSVTVAATDGAGRTYANVLRPRAIFLDFDEGDPPGIVWENASALVRTARGWHAYFFLRHPDPAQPDWKMWELAQEVAAKTFGAERIVDHTKAMRLPGFYHQKRDPKIVELQRCDPHRFLLPEVVAKLELTLDFLRQPSGPTPRRARPSRYDPSRLGTSERLEQYREWTAKQPPAIEGSGGHDALLRVIKMAWNFGLDWSAAWAVIEDFNARCDPPWRPRALRSQFESAGPIAESRGRFSADSWQSALWVPEPERIVREGPKPEEVPPEAAPAAKRTIHRSEPPPEEIPWPDDVVAQPPEDPPWPEDTDAPDGGEPKLILDPERPLEGAERFVEKHCTDEGRRTLHRHHRVYWSWEGHYYRQLSDEGVETALYTFTKRALRWAGVGDNTKLVPYGTKRTKIADVERALRSVCILDDTMSAPCWLDETRDDPDPAELLVCRNGVIHLPTGRFIPPDPRLFVLNSLGVAFTPEYKRPQRWIAFLEQLWPEDRQSVALLQEWFGYCLTPDISHHKALMLVGPPRAGKGTIAHILEAILGAASVTSMMMGDFVSEFGLWRLIGKSLAIIPDARVSGRYDSASIVEKFLAITGGDLVSVNRKNLAPVDLQLRSRFMLLTNVVPQIADAAAAFPQRLLALSLERSFVGKEDRDLLGNLRTELPAILNWAIEGWHRLRAHGHFTQPATSRHVAEALEEASSPVRAFVRQCCTLDPEEFSPTTELYDAWKRWCAFSGRQAGSISTFGRNLRAGVPEIGASRPRSGEERARGFSGIGVDYTRLPRAEEKAYRSPQTGFSYDPGDN